MDPAPTHRARSSRRAAGGPPADARLSFSLDGWGQLDTERTRTRRPSSTTSTFAGTALGLEPRRRSNVVKSCSDPGAGLQCGAGVRPLRPRRCSGPSWVTDYTESWHSLATPNGYIEQGQAVATDNLWTQPPSAQSQSEISAPRRRTCSSSARWPGRTSSTCSGARASICRTSSTCSSIRTPKPGSSSSSRLLSEPCGARVWRAARVPSTLATRKATEDRARQSFLLLSR